MGLFDTRFSIWTFVSGHEPSPSIVVFLPPLADNALTKGILNNCSPPGKLLRDMASKLDIFVYYDINRIPLMSQADTTYCLRQWRHSNLWFKCIKGREYRNIFMVELGDKKKHAHTLLPSEPALRVKAIETLLVEKGLIDPAAIDAMVEAFEGRIGPKNGARVVAKAWKNPEYKARLLLDASGAIAELGYSGLQGEHMVAIENTERVHNLVVCTLCS